MKSLIQLGILVFSMTLLTACGGGSGSTSVESDDSSGFLTVSIGDNDISDFDRALFEISQIVVLGDNGQTVILDEQRTIDFLALETVNEVLAEAVIPSGQYNKVRLKVDSIELIKLDNQGDILETVDVRLVANGKVDIVPRGEFTIEPDSTLALDIDIDLEKSIKLTTTGAGRYIFRPVIFATIISQANDGRVVRLEGEFEAIEEEGVRLDDRFRLCAAELMSDNDQVIESPSCRLVLIDTTTPVFETSPSLSPTQVENLMNGDNIVVYGLLRPDAYEHGSIESYGTPVAALVTAKGEFSRAEGVANSMFDAVNETFELELAPGQGIVGDLTLTADLPLGNGALLIDREGNAVESTVISNGREIELEGLLSLGTPNRFEAFIALIVAEQASVTINGMATEINLTSNILTLVDGSSSFCVQITGDTTIQQINSSDEATTVDSVSIGSLLDASIEVTGIVNPDTGCIDADSIILDTSAIL